MGETTDKLETVVMGMGDLNGVLRGKRIPIHHWPSIKEQGMTMSNAIFALDVTCDVLDYSYTGFETGYPDLLVFPEGDLQPLGWDPSAAFVFGVARDEHGDPIPVDPRNVLIRVLDQARELGMEIQIGAELEFYLLDSETLQPKDTGIDVYGLSRALELEPILGPIRNDLTAAGIPIEQSNPEYAPGQVEVNIRYGEALAVADQVVAFRGMIKQIAVANGLVASFMAKPFIDESGSGFHVHHSAWRNGDPLFAQDGKLSQTGLHYLAGMRRRMAETAIISASNPNAYRRRQPMTFCPTNNSWGFDNRTVGLRVIEGHDNAVRIEQRDGSAENNPYLLIAAQIAAGLEGIVEELDPGAPTTGNAYLSEDADPIPTSLDQALVLASASEFVQDLLGPGLFEAWRMQAEREIEFVTNQVTPVELDRYLRRL